MYICNLLSFIFHLLIVFTNSPEAKDLNQPLPAFVATRYPTCKMGRLMGGKRERKANPGILSKFLSLSFIIDADFNKNINTSTPPAGCDDWSYLVVPEQ